MATALFDRIVPSGKDALFPFQMSAASLTLSATVYQIAGSDGAKTSVGAGVTTSDDGGGLYRLKVTSGNMSSGNMYYAIVTSGNEAVRIPMWSYAPTDHISDVLSRIGGSAAAMSFTGILNGANNLQGAVDLLGVELGDFSAAGITGAPATAAAAMKIIFDNVDTLENSIGLENDADTAATLFGRIKKNKAVADAIKVDTNDLRTAVGDGNDAASADYGTDKSLMGMVRLLGADVAANQTDLNSIISKVDVIDGIVDELTTQGDTNEGKLDVIDGNVDQIEGMLGALSDAASADYATDKTAMGMIRKLGADVAENQADLDTILADTNELQGDWANGGRLDLLLDGAKAAAEAARDDLANGTDGLGALKAGIDANQVDLDAIIADLSNGTDGLGALKGLIDANQVDLDAIIADLSNGTDGLGALKALIDTVNTDLSNGTDGLGALKALIDTVDGVVDATKVVVDAQESKTQADTRQTALVAEHDATQATLGAPAGASVSADIAAVKAVADTLSLQVNAVLQPMVPSEVYSGSAAKRFVISMQTIDGATGAMDDQDETGSPAGQMYIEILNSAGSRVTAMHDAGSGGSALSQVGGSDGRYGGDVNNYFIMNRVSTGFYQAWVEIAAYDVDSYDVLFYSQDSDPNTAQVFRAMRRLEIRSPVQAQFAGGAF